MNSVVSRAERQTYYPACEGTPVYRYASGRGSRTSIARSTSTSTPRASAARLPLRIAVLNHGERVGIPAASFPPGGSDVSASNELKIAGVDLDLAAAHRGCDSTSLMKRVRRAGSAAAGLSGRAGIQMNNTFQNVVLLFFIYGVSGLVRWKWRLQRAKTVALSTAVF